MRRHGGIEGRGEEAGRDKGVVGVGRKTQFPGDVALGKSYASGTRAAQARPSRPQKPFYKLPLPGAAFPLLQPLPLRYPGYEQRNYIL